GPLAFTIAAAGWGWAVIWLILDIADIAARPDFEAYVSLVVIFAMAGLTLHYMTQARAYRLREAARLLHRSRLDEVNALIRRMEDNPFYWSPGQNPESYIQPSCDHFQDTVEAFKTLCINLDRPVLCDG